MITTNEKKVTLATIKSFIKKGMEADNLYISNLSDFDGMVDCVMPSRDSAFKKATASDRSEHNLGVNGAWFVKSSRDYFEVYNDGVFKGYTVSNCCGSFIIATK